MATVGFKGLTKISIKQKTTIVDLSLYVLLARHASSVCFYG